MLVAGLSCSKQHTASPPAVESISPTDAPGGADLTITGRGFSPVSSQNVVLVNGKTAVVTQASDTVLVITVPSLAGSGAVTVEVNGVSSGGPDFTYDYRYIVTTFAGTGAVGASDGAPAMATFSLPFGIAIDSSGNVYGVTELGGNSRYCVNMFVESVGCGVVFKLSQTAKGGWAESALYRFFGNGDGAVPIGGLTFDAAGNLYGNASAGGSLAGNCSENAGCGMVFELSPTAAGLWHETHLHTFSISEGSGPHGALALDASGNLFGSTSWAGSSTSNGGTVFELTPGASGWTLTTLHAFQRDGVDGLTPSGVLLAPSGHILGTTSIGGSVNGGIVYEITP